MKLDGPTGPTEDHWSADLVTVGERVFMGTPEGTFARIGDGWELAWDVAPASVSSPRLLATGDDELWVVDTRAVRHVQDGVLADELEWTTHVADTGVDASFGRDLTLGPDGAVWVAGPDGVAYRDGDRWEFIDKRKAAAVAVDAAGTVWAARPIQSGGCRMWILREEDGAWVRKDIDGCPLQYPTELSLEVDGDGAVWLGGTGLWMPGGLARYADGEWETIDAIGDAEVFGATVLGTDGDGAVWVVSQENLGSENTIHAVRGPMARFDGDDVSIFEPPEASGDEPQIAIPGMPWTTLGADGMPWTASERGLARFDGEAWQYLDEHTAYPWMRFDTPSSMRVGAVATDGSVYGIPAFEGGHIIRFPAANE
jgi:ligand-binding sensor domain-containing protein